jgi:hypothetical protein
MFNEAEFRAKFGVGPVAKKGGGSGNMLQEGTLRIQRSRCVISIPRAKFEESAIGSHYVYAVAQKGPWSGFLVWSRSERPGGAHGVASRR